MTAISHLFRGGIVWSITVLFLFAACGGNIVHSVPIDGQAIADGDTETPDQTDLSDDPATDDPATDDPVTDDPVTDDPVTDDQSDLSDDPVADADLAECTHGLTDCDNDLLRYCNHGLWQVMEDCAADGKICALEPGGQFSQCVTPPECGNGVLEAGEQCDDNNKQNGDGCDEFCNEESTGRFDFTGPTYTGNKLLIINTATSGETQESSGTLPATLTALSAQPGLPTLPLLLDRRVPLSDDLRTAKIARKSAIPLLAPAVGSTETFKLVDLNSGQTSPVTATLQYAGTNCLVYAQNTGNISTSFAQSIGEEFDSTIYPLITGTFYDPSDINSDGTITLFFADLGGQAGGFFNPEDLMDTENSNLRDMIYIDDTVGDSYSNEVIAHEFQHLVHNNRQVVVEGDQNPLYDLGYRWIDEGFAMMAIHLYRGTQSMWLDIYNQNNAGTISDGFSLLYWDYYNNETVYTNYTLSYLFFTYLWTNVGRDDTIFRTILEDSNNNYQAVIDLINDRINPNYTFGQFMTYFRLALLVNDPTGIYGFNGESGFDLTTAFYTGTGSQLRGGGAFFKSIAGSFTEPGDQGADIIYVGIQDF